MPITMIDSDTVVTKSTSPHMTSAAQKVTFASRASILDTVITPRLLGEKLGPNRAWLRDNSHKMLPGSGLRIGSIVPLRERLECCEREFTQRNDILTLVVKRKDAAGLQIHSCRAEPGFRGSSLRARIRN